jgi:hypothetical protein
MWFSIEHNFDNWVSFVSRRRTWVAGSPSEIESSRVCTILGNAMSRIDMEKNETLRQTAWSPPKDSLDRSLGRNIEAGPDGCFIVAVFVKRAGVVPSMSAAE